MSYDSSCEDLAISFLEDHPKLKSEKNIKALAQEIQDAIENWLEANGAFDDEENT